MNGKISLREARKSAGYTQGEIAEKMGVSTPTVCFWERGTVRIKATDLMEYCNIVGVSVADIFLPERFRKLK